MALKKEVKKKIWVWLLKAPLVFLILGSFIASIYAASKGIAEITYGTPVVFAVIIALYIWGIYLDKKRH